MNKGCRRTPANASTQLQFAHMPRSEPRLVIYRCGFSAREKTEKKKKERRPVKSRGEKHYACRRRRHDKKLIVTIYQSCFQQSFPKSRCHCGAFDITTQIVKNRGLPVHSQNKRDNNKSKRRIIRRDVKLIIRSAYSLDIHSPFYPAFINSSSKVNCKVLWKSGERKIIAHGRINCSIRIFFFFFFFSKREMSRYRKILAIL